MFGIKGTVSVKQQRRAVASRNVRARSAPGGTGGGSFGGRGGRGGGGGGGAESRSSGSSSWGRSAGLALASAALFSAGDARAATKTKDFSLSDTFSNGDFAKHFSGQAGLSALVGYATALALKVLAGASLLLVVAFFAGMKWLETNDLIVVKWNNIQAFYSKQTGNLKQIETRFEGFMAQTVPSVAGFGAGFLMGMR